MDNNELIESLSPIERTILPSLTTTLQDIQEIQKKADTDKTSVLRALEFLKNKKLVETKEESKKILKLGVNGIYYSKKELPERKLLNKLADKKAILISQITKQADLNENEAKISIGVLKRKALVNLSNGKIILTADKKDITKKMLEEKLIEKLPLELDNLQPEDKLAMQNLKSRKDIIQLDEEKEIQAKLTKLGEEVSKMDLDADLIEQLTPKMIKQKKYKGKKFRRYDIISPVPKIYGGKRHFVNQATDHAKQIWLDMGFKEMTGNLVQSGFWNFDALFTAQDHPVREMQDTFFIKDVKAELPDIKEKVKQSHEGGNEIAGGKSKGWNQEWFDEPAKKLSLRTHTTCLSIQTLNKIADKIKQNEKSKKQDKENQPIPAKYFALGKCFRNETVDWSHGFEFNQTEGIVIDENANFRQLLGYLKEFFRKMGYEKIRIRPAYFPYTEPSLEIDVYNEKRKQWVELGGAGMFRPEVTTPIFGKHIPVLAWGPGFDRIIMEFFKIEDLRDMYKNDITKLRQMKFWRE